MPNALLLPLASQEENALFMCRSFRLSHAQRVQLELLATAAQVTLNTLLLGAFAQVMGFYNEQRHFTLTCRSSVVMDNTMIWIESWGISPRSHC